MKNIDQFNEVVGLVFAKLYQEFPNETTLDISEFTYEDVNQYKVDCDGIDIWQLDGHPKLVRSAIEWLIEESYISNVSRPNAYNPLHFLKCRLTNKGFVALDALPQGLQSSETLGDQLVGFAKESAIQQGKDGIGALVKMALAFGTSYLGTP